MTTTNEREALVEALRKEDAHHGASIEWDGMLRCICGWERLAARMQSGPAWEAFTIHVETAKLDALLALRLEDGSEAVILASQVVELEDWCSGQHSIRVHPREVVRSGDIESNRTTEVVTP